jgi:hypothetical protein
MAWDEWEQLKAGAAERHSAEMQLNQASGDPRASGGGGTGTLRHTGGPWTKTADTADDLQISTVTSKVELRSAHDGITGGAAGLASLGVLKAVLNSWDKRLGRVRDECIALGPKLRQVAVDLGEVDVQVGNKTDAVTVPGTRRGE